MREGRCCGANLSIAAQSGSFCDASCVWCLQLDPLYCSSPPAAHALRSGVRVPGDKHQQ